MSIGEAIELAAQRLEAARSAAPASGGLSCQHSYNCTNTPSKRPGYKRGKVKYAMGWSGEIGDAQGRSWINCGKGVMHYRGGELTGQEAKAAYILRGWVVDFIKYFGRDHCAFLTMTDAHSLHPREFAKRFHSWRTHEGACIIGYIRILEPQLRGAPHYHLLVSVAWNMLPDRFDWPSFWEADKAYKAGDKAAHHAARRHYKESAAPEAVALWGRMRKTLPKYGLGRAEFLPLRKEAEAVAEYLGKYLDASLMIRIDDWKGCRRVERDRKSAKLWSRHNREFAWFSEGGTQWRKRIGELAEALGIVDYDEFQERYGPRWAYHIRDRILIAEDEEWQESLSVMRTLPNAFDIFRPGAGVVRSQALQQRGRISREIQVKSISDTIAIFTKCDEEDGVTRAIETHGELCRWIIPRSIEAEIPVRGAIAFGEFETGENIFVGKAIDEAASWHEQADWIGVHLTPSAEYVFEPRLAGKGWAKFNPPTKIGLKWTPHCVCWLDSKDWQREVDKIKVKFRRLGPIVPEIAGKFANTLSFLEAKQSVKSNCV